MKLSTQILVTLFTLFLAPGLRAQNPANSDFGEKLWDANVLNVTKVIGATGTSEDEGSLISVAFNFGQLFSKAPDLKIGDREARRLEENDRDLVLESFHIVGNKLMMLSTLFRANERSKAMISRHSEKELLKIFRKEMVTIASLIANTYWITKPADIRKMYTAFESIVTLDTEESRILRKQYSLEDLKSFNQGMNDAFKDLK
jgi:hypothetical protein